MTKFGYLNDSSDWGGWHCSEITCNISCVIMGLIMSTSIVAEGVEERSFRSRVGCCDISHFHWAIFEQIILTRYSAVWDFKFLHQEYPDTGRLIHAPWLGRLPQIKYFFQSATRLTARPAAWPPGYLRASGGSPGLLGTLNIAHSLTGGDTERAGGGCG